MQASCLPTRPRALPCCPAGRTHDNRLVKGKQVLVVWDANTSKWIVPGGPWGWGAAWMPVRKGPCPATVSTASLATA